MAANREMPLDPAHVFVECLCRMFLAALALRRASDVCSKHQKSINSQVARMPPELL